MGAALTYWSRVDTLFEHLTRSFSTLSFIIDMILTEAFPSGLVDGERT
jgi:hypothetical protein